MAAVTPPGSFSFDVRIVPNAPRNAVERNADGSWKVRVHAPAVDGKANEALLRYLAKEVFGVPVSAVALVKGEKNRNKTVRVELPSKEALARLSVAAER